MTNFYSLKDFADGPHMVVDPKGKWAWAADLAAARSEIERLTVERDFFLSEVKLRNRIPSTNDTAADLLRRAEKAEAERDEARAQVASMWKGPGETPHRYSPDYMSQGDCRVCGHTREAHQNRLEAYGREKVREGMQRAADIALCHSDNRPRRYNMDWNDGYIDGCKGASDDILAKMEKLK